MPSMLLRLSRLQTSQVQTWRPFSTPSAQVRRAADSSPGIHPHVAQTGRAMYSFIRPASTADPHGRYLQRHGNPVDRTFHTTTRTAAVARWRPGPAGVWRLASGVWRLASGEVRLGSRLCDRGRKRSTGNGLRPGRARRNDLLHDDRQPTSQPVMQRICMTRDPSGDFDQPRVTDSFLRRHVLYRISRADWERRGPRPPTPAPSLGLAVVCQHRP